MKSKQEIMILANIIRTAAEGLPEFNAFDEPNEDEVETLREVYRDLYMVAGGKEPENDDVAAWVSGEQSDLNDFLM